MQPVVYILDDDEGLRASLSWLVGSVGLKTVAFGSAEAFFAAFDPALPGCLVLDVRMPEIGGFEVQQKLIDMGHVLPIIFVSGHGDIPMSVRAMKKGAFDFIEKPYNSQNLLERIQECIKLSTARQSTATQRNRIREQLATLSQRERQVLHELAGGKSSKEIARNLSITAKTVDIHRSNIRQKLGGSPLNAFVHELLVHFSDEFV